MKYKINAQVQLIPLNLPTPAMALIDEAIAVINASGLPYSVGPFGTSVEGYPEEILALINKLHVLADKTKGSEWLINVQWHGASGKDVSAIAKTQKFTTS